MPQLRRVAPTVLGLVLALAPPVDGSPVKGAATASPTPSAAPAPGPQSAEAGRSPVLDGTGRIPTTGTTLPAAPVQVHLLKVAGAAQPLAFVQRKGDDRQYIVEKEGRIRAFPPSDGATGDRTEATESALVVDMANRVASVNERGLLGLAFSPTDPGLLYIAYTDLRGQVVVSELPFDGKIADITRERVMLRIPKPFNEHNAGTIAFGPDNLLYIGIGDGGGAGDRFNNGQRTDVLLGKVLRIDPKPSGSLPYTIPPSNPFAKSNGLRVAKQRTEILAYGLRNPWRISVDAQTGDVWIPDVGQDGAEEINRLPLDRAGANFGWRLREGLVAFKGARPIGAVDPVYAYPHKDGRCAVVGGALYRGSALPALVGWYVFGDVCTGQLSALRPTANGWVPMSLGARVSYLTAFGVGNDGELYATSLEGAVVKLVP